MKWFIRGFAKSFLSMFYIEGYNTIDGRYSGLKQIRLGIVLGKWFIQLNLFVYSIRFGLLDK